MGRRNADARGTAQRNSKEASVAENEEGTEVKEVRASSVWLSGLWLLSGEDGKPWDHHWVE